MNIHCVKFHKRNADMKLYKHKLQSFEIGLSVNPAHVSDMILVTLVPADVLALNNATASAALTTTSDVIVKKFLYVWHVFIDQMPVLILPDEISYSLFKWVAVTWLNKSAVQCQKSSLNQYTAPNSKYIGVPPTPSMYASAPPTPPNKWTLRARFMGPT